MLRPTDIPKKKLLLLKQTPESITTTLKYLETIRARELTQIKEAVFLFSLEMWPGLALDSSFGNHLSAKKLKFLVYLEENTSAFNIFCAAVRYWLGSTNNIPEDPEAFLQPVKAAMANDENGKEYNLPKDGSSLPSSGQILPDQCSSPTSRLYHLTRLGNSSSPAPTILDGSSPYCLKKQGFFTRTVLKGK